jgi:hypothetical protein
VQLQKNSLQPLDWPESQVRKRILKVIPDKKLRELLHLYQTDITRIVRKDGRKIAKANLEDITIAPNNKEKKFKRLRIKIIAPKGATHLAKITKVLQTEWPLEVENRSKFERALAIEMS